MARFYPFETLPQDLQKSNIRPFSLLHHVPDHGNVSVRSDGTHSVFNARGDELLRAEPEYSEQHVEDWLNVVEKNKLGIRDRSYAEVPGAYPAGWHHGAGWMISPYSYTAPSLPVIGRMTCKFKVPQQPTTNVGQILSVWPGIMAGAFGGTPLLQPVLHWGFWIPSANTAFQWGIVNWYLNKFSKVFHGTSLPVNVSAVLTADIQCWNWNNSTQKQSWRCSFVGQNNSFDVLNMPVPFFHWAAVVHESRYTKKVSDYFSPYAQFTDIHVRQMVQPAELTTPRTSTTKTITKVLTPDTTYNYHPFSFTPAYQGGSAVVNNNVNPGGRITIYPPTKAP